METKGPKVDSVDENGEVGKMEEKEDPKKQTMDAFLKQHNSIAAKGDYDKTEHKDSSLSSVAEDADIATAVATTLSEIEK